MVSLSERLEKNALAINWTKVRTSVKGVDVEEDGDLDHEQPKVPPIRLLKESIQYVRYDDYREKQNSVIVEMTLLLSVY